ncbi:hypothetical protein, partial [Pseudomonas asplenii]|uniref:hypothetical protein n=1 Tax=Pseudomonas asplenii TaxID=53407 RepID=UPI001E61987F
PVGAGLAREPQSAAIRWKLCCQNRRYRQQAGSHRGRVKPGAASIGWHRDCIIPFKQFLGIKTA